MDIKNELRSQVNHGWETVKNIRKEVQEKLEATIKPRIDHLETQIKQMSHHAIDSANEVWSGVKHSIQSFRKHD